jgi:hypothetical protein
LVPERRLEDEVVRGRNYGLLRFWHLHHVVPFIESDPYQRLEANVPDRTDRQAGHVFTPE